MHVHTRCTVDILPNSGQVALFVDFLTSFYGDVTIAQSFKGKLDRDIILKKFANDCHVGLKPNVN